MLSTDRINYKRVYGNFTPPADHRSGPADVDLDEYWKSYPSALEAAANGDMSFLSSTAI